jgi:hypothetical protein
MVDPKTPSPTTVSVCFMRKFVRLVRRAGDTLCASCYL